MVQVERICVKTDVFSTFAGDHFSYSQDLYAYSCFDAIWRNSLVITIGAFKTYHDLSFKSVSPVLSLISFIASRHFNVGAICLGIHENTRSTSIICRRLLVLDQEDFYKTKYS